MGRPHSVTIVRRPTPRSHKEGWNASRRPDPPPLPLPPLTPVEFIESHPSMTTIIRLSRATASERVRLVRRVIDRFKSYRPGQEDDRLTLETATAFFVASVAIRAGMRGHGRDPDDEDMLRNMRDILVNCVTRENARDVATMMHIAPVQAVSATLDDQRITARPVMQRILAFGFLAVEPEIRVMTNSVLVVVTTERPDRLGGWTTVTNASVPLGTHIPRNALMLVSRPLPRPLDWEPGKDQRTVSYVSGGTPVFIDPSFIR